MDLLIQLISEYGLPLLFVSILVEQLGIPLPAYPMLMVTGALAARNQFNLLALLSTAVLACFVADSAWYLIGRRMGPRVLVVLCRISLSPDGCVRQTESIFTRFGPPSLAAAKFVPGFASVATALAGATHMRRGQFLLFDTIGAIVWTGVALALGWMFSPAIEDIVATLETLGKWGLLLAVVGLSVFVGTKWWQRYRFNLQMRMERVSAGSLGEMLDKGERPLIIDVRSAPSREQGRIPGAIAVANGNFGPEVLNYPKDGLVVVYCACPNDASAVMVVRDLHGRGFLKARPLAGGIEAWASSGRSIET